MIDKELIELLPLELQLVLCVLLDGLLVRDGVVLGSQVGLERHHGGLDGVVGVGRGGGRSAQRGAAAASAGGAVATPPAVASGRMAAPIIVVPRVAAVVAVPIVPENIKMSKIKI